MREKVNHGEEMERDILQTLRTDIEDSVDALFKACVALAVVLDCKKW